MRLRRRRQLPSPPIVPALAFTILIVTAGCGSAAPLIQKHSFDFKTTALFPKACLPPRPEPVVPESASAGPTVALLVDKPAPGKLETKENQCNSTYIERMVENFMAIREADDTRGVPGDTIDEVRRRGFTIYLDAGQRVRRPNTRVLHGTEALAAIGMAISPPPLQTPAEIKAYTEFMGQHYGEEYVERDMKHVVDRFCINRRESLEVGDDRIFTIVWRGGRVLRRVIKGGPVDNPKQERAFLLCPGNFIIDTITGAASRAANTLTPVP